MQCCVCKEKEAKVHLTQIVGDKMQKVDLCEDCAKQKGVNDPAGFSLADLLLGLGASQEMEQATAGGSDMKCPHCGFTHADFKKAGRLGCAECYVTFADGLEALLKTMHKGTRHIGKVPAALQQTRDLSDRLKSLQKKLDKAVGEEDFEQAAILRDEIKAMKEKMGNLATS
jgi:protein arginine kinase activator